MKSVGETTTALPGGPDRSRSDFWVGLTVLTALCFGGLMMIRLFL